MPTRHIAVSGPIGAGKTTLVRGLSEALGFKAHEERFEVNPYLSRFYSDPRNWALHNFLFFFEQTLLAYREASQGDISIVQERVLEEHLDVFGAQFHESGYLSDEDFALITRLVDSIRHLVTRPDLLVYLDVSTEESMRRLRARQHPAESEIELSYLKALHKRYAGFISMWPGRVLRLNADSHDFRRTKDVSDVATAIQQAVGREHFSEK
jgi:deoxyguanosine kinase